MSLWTRNARKDEALISTVCPESSHVVSCYRSREGLSTLLKHIVEPYKARSSKPAHPYSFNSLTPSLSISTALNEN